MPSKAKVKTSSKKTSRPPKRGRKNGARAKGNGAAAKGIMKPVRPDRVLGAVVGNEPLSRPEITRRLWEYIREHDLQDPKDRRKILCDENLRPLFDGKRKISMLEMAGFVSEHIRAA
jgi:chromatin remodeling complex protein RSC6